MSLSFPSFAQVISRNKRFFYFLETIIIFGLVFAFRLYVSYPVENSGDSFVKWFQAKRLLYGFDYSRLDHHTMRWAINFLSLFFQKVFGPNPSTYYLVSAFAASGSSLFLYRIGILLRDRFLGVTALLLFTFHPSIIIFGGQLFPGIFSVFYTLGSVYFLLLYVKNERNLHLIISACFLFLAYGAKITNLFFLPALLVYLLFEKRSIKILVLYLLVLFLGFCIETFVIDILMGDFTLPGRLALIGGHLNKVESGLEGEKSLWGILTRWQMLRNYMFIHTITGFFASFYFFNKKKQYRLELLPSLCLLSFSFLITFGLCGIHPVHYFLPHMPRYLNVTIPFSILLTLCLVGQLNENKYLVVAFLLLALPYPVYLNRDMHNAQHRQFYKVDAYQKKVMHYFNEGYAFLFFNAKNARLYKSFFLDDQFAIGFDNKKPVNIYVVRPGKTPINKNRFLFVLVREGMQRIPGIVRPYSDKYELKIEKAKKVNITLPTDAGVLW